GSFNTISAIEAFNLKVVKSHGHIVLAGEGYVPPTGEVFPERVIHLDLARQMELMDQLVTLVPMYKLDCNMDIEAAKVAYAGMQ
ncbi:MAG: hypothetical protein IIV78_05280, partial [Oscillospiraceae bacterium]|nr:hypothetical protein [Oscillospiraceae bacterium]